MLVPLRALVLLGAFDDVEVLLADAETLCDGWEFDARIHSRRPSGWGKRACAHSHEVRTHYVGASDGEEGYRMIVTQPESRRAGMRATR